MASDIQKQNIILGRIATALENANKLTIEIERDARAEYTENTMTKVADALRETELRGNPGTHLNEEEITDLINAMQNKSILFRVRGYIKE